MSPLIGTKRIQIHQPWKNYAGLTDQQLDQLAAALTEEVEPNLVKPITKTLSLDPNAPREVDRVEMLFEREAREELYAKFW